VNTEKKDFTPGDLISFCSEQFLVVSNYGESGTVVEYPAGPVINNFHWKFESEPCKFVKRTESTEFDAKVVLNRLKELNRN
jgi:hypothetical protein